MRSEHLKRREHYWEWTTEPKVRACARCGWATKHSVYYRRGGDWIRMAKRPECES
jgi:hypothetical protein